MSGRQADWERAKTLYPHAAETSEANVERWVSKFDENPQIMWSILGDIAKVYKATEGPRKTGRRPGVTNMSLRELESIITPRYSMEPLAVSLPELIGQRSLRAFAAKIPMHHRSLARVIAGEAPLSLALLEQIARAGKVSPNYFLEYRSMYVADMLTSVFKERPNMSVTAVKAIQKLLAS